MVVVLTLLLDIEIFDLVELLLLVRVRLAMIFIIVGAEPVHLWVQDDAWRLTILQGRA